MAKGTKVEVVKFAIEIGDALWSKVYETLKTTYPNENGEYGSRYCIRGIYEENSEKFVIVENRIDGLLFKIGLNYTDTEFNFVGEPIAVELKFMEAETVTQYSKEEVQKYEEALKCEEIEEEQPKVEEVDMVEKLAEIEKQLEEANKLISEYSEKIEKLEQFKNETLNAKKDSIVCETMSQVKEFVDAETYSKYEESGVACQYEDIGSWKNEVLASITDKALAKMSEISSKEDGILDMGIVIETKDSTKSIYD